MAFPIGWQRACPLTVDHTAIKASSLANFPVLLTAGCLPAEMVTLAGANAAQADGGDIRFSSDASGLVQLACEVVLWTQHATPASATAEIWVRVSSLSGTADTVIYVWYKAATTQTQPATGAAFGRDAVWSSEVKGVWHLGSGSVLSLTDSTGNGNTGTNHSAAAAAGKVGGAASFNGSSQYIDLGTGASLAVAGVLTLQGWIKAAVSQSGFPQIVSRNDSSGITGFNLYLTSTPYYPGMIVLESGGTWGSTFASGVVALNDNAWHLVAGVYAGASADIYVDGVRVATDATTQKTSITYGTSPSAIMGAKLPLTGTYFSGLLDEVRITAALRSPAWIATEYANQNAPALFTVAGTAYSPGAYGDPAGFYGQQFRAI